jgi:hypothetical protein
MGPEMTSSIKELLESMFATGLRYNNFYFLIFLLDEKMIKNLVSCQSDRQLPQ